MRNDKQPPERGFDCSPRDVYVLMQGGSVLLGEPYRLFLSWPSTFGDGFHCSLYMVGVLLHCAIVGCISPEHAGPLFLLFGAAIFVHTCAGLWRNPNLHSRYDGYPIICVVRRWLTGNPGDELDVKEAWEPTLLLAVACCLPGWSPGLAVSVLAGAVGSCVTQGISRGQVRAHARAYRNAKVSARNARYYRTGEDDPNPMPVIPGLAPPAKPGRLLARRAFGGCLLAVAWMSYTGELKPQWAMVQALAARVLPVAGLETSAHPQPFRGEARSTPHVDDQRLQAERERRERQTRQRAAWRRWNAGYGGY